MAAKNTFFYFGYGSNLLRERIKLQNKSAVFISIAKLKKHKLIFSFDTEPKDRKMLNWRGCPANIEQNEDGIVWGVVWKLLNEDMSNLDDQEGVSSNIYRPIEVEVETPDKKQITCRSYTLVKTSDEGDNRPSPQYMDIILRGAVQNSLPEDYITFLKSIEHNNHSDRVELYESVLKLIE